MFDTKLGDEEGRVRALERLDILDTREETALNSSRHWSGRPSMSR